MGNSTTYHFAQLSDLPEASVGVLICRHILPYLERGLIIPFFEACYRALAPGGWMRCTVPSTSGRAAFSNPIYRSYWNQSTFQTFCNALQADLAGGHNCRFQYVRAWETWESPEDYQAKMFLDCVDLVALKGQKQPGLIEI
jgi:hypothetical protein